jgi:hypothetical protein
MKNYFSLVIATVLLSLACCSCEKVDSIDERPIPPVSDPLADSLLIDYETKSSSNETKLVVSAKLLLDGEESVDPNLNVLISRVTVCFDEDSIVVPTECIFEDVRETDLDTPWVNLPAGLSCNLTPICTPISCPLGYDVVLKLSYSVRIRDDLLPGGARFLFSGIKTRHLYLSPYIKQDVNADIVVTLNSIFFHVTVDSF